MINHYFGPFHVKIHNETQIKLPISDKFYLFQLISFKD